MAHLFVAGLILEKRSVRQLTSVPVLFLICTLPGFAEQPNPASDTSLEAIVEQLKRNESALPAVSVTLDHSRYMSLFTLTFAGVVEVDDHRIEEQLDASNENNSEEPAEEQESDKADEAAGKSKGDAPAEATNDREPLYDPEADAKKMIADATARAKRDGKHVIIKFGGNWCGWCYRLNSFLHENEVLATLLDENYELVLVDVNSNRDLFLGYGEDNQKHGFPFLTVLDDDGSVLVNQSTAVLEEGQSYNTAAVLDF